MLLKYGRPLWLREKEDDKGGGVGAGKPDDKGVTGAGEKHGDDKATAELAATKATGKVSSRRSQARRGRQESRRRQAGEGWRGAEAAGREAKRTR